MGRGPALRLQTPIGTLDIRNNMNENNLIGSTSFNGSTHVVTIEPLGYDMRLDVPDDLEESLAALLKSMTKAHRNRSRLYLLAGKRAGLVSNTRSFNSPYSFSNLALCVRRS